MTEGILPEDAHSYASQLHRDCVRIAAALERLAAVAESVANTGVLIGGPVRVAQSGSWITREDRP